MFADNNRRARAHIDVQLILMVMGMSLFGIIAVTVATYSISSEATNLLGHILESSSALKQCFFVLLLAPMIMAIVIAIPYQTIKKFTRFAYFGITGLVLVVWVLNRAEGVKAWLDVIWDMTIQPSEFIKLAIILMLAQHMSQVERPLSTPKDFWETMFLVGVPCLIILLSGETGSMIVIVFSFAVMLLFANVDAKMLGIMALTVVLGLLLLYAVMVTTGVEDYRLSRILAFLNPELSPQGDAYQMRQSQMTIGSGGISGIGTFVDGSMSQLNYVPADWTDFIYATIGEAWGFVGCFAILLMYLLIIFRMLYLARYTYDRYGMLVIVGVVGMLLFHVLENIGMTLGLFPITGIPLPFLSYGGSNMVTNIGGVALVLNVTKNRSLTGFNATQTVVAPRRYT